MSRRRLRQLFARGHTSLGIGNRLCRGFSCCRQRSGTSIGGWVAMWRPMELFLYDWWPIRAEARLADRLTAMPVRVVREPAAAAAG